MKLKATLETEVYISQGGYLAIKQRDQLGGRDDPVILLSPHQAQLVAQEIGLLLQDLSWWSDMEDED